MSPREPWIASGDTHRHGPLAEVILGMTDMLDINLNVLRHDKSSVDFVVTVILLMKLLLPRPEAAACPFE